jgi:hypothetical protein
VFRASTRRHRARTSDFWVYENWRAHGPQSRVHIGGCRYCNDGRGVSTGTRVDNGKWRGPFATYREAANVAEGPPGETNACRICRPASLPT